MRRRRSQGEYRSAQRGGCSMTRRRALQRLGLLALLLTGRDLVYGATIVAVRVWPADDYTRVTIESDAALSVKHFLIDNPSRLVIDIDGLELSPQLRELVGKVRSDDPYIAGVRVGQNQPRVVRLVIDLKQSIAPQLFTLTPVAAYQHRTVFDLRPVQERDPLLALIVEKESAEQQAAQAVQDALGEFIGRVDGPKAHPPPGGASGVPRAAPAQHAARQDRPPDHRRARSGPRRRRPRRDRPARAEGKGRRAADRAALARTHQCAAGLARDADARRRLLRAAAAARAESAPRAGRPVRVDPCRRVHDAAGAAAHRCSRCPTRARRARPRAGWPSARTPPT